MTRPLVRTALLVVLVGSGCGLLPATASEVPIGGIRPGSVEVDLQTARDEIPGGVLEPTWLPEGFELVDAGHDGGNWIESLTLTYIDGTHQVRVWQTTADMEETPEIDPVREGEPVEVAGITWRVHRLPADQVGALNVVQYSARMPDGRTVSVDSDLAPDAMERILASLAVRDSGDGD